ncbi:Aste57867_2473 [Aphanomyces stellatus]|uniref:Aste57867_2473 protein n=1 Tax=Aphanomyces stellatus TaxID=120398 RepID=A0A485KDB5_9STRA|nr:hypothetical protein As57867_002467 [Aphanomyces stellatus]VFT79672.1 Aste57867_2473 [Aphanomyces stellatus]
MAPFTTVRVRNLRYFVALHAAYMARRAKYVGLKPHEGSFDLRCLPLELQLENFYLLVVHDAGQEVIAFAQQTLQDLLEEMHLPLLSRVRGFLTRERFEVAVLTDKQQVVPGLWIASTQAVMDQFARDKDDPPKFRRCFVCCKKAQEETAPVRESDDSIDLDVDDEHKIDLYALVHRLQEKKAECGTLVVYCNTGISLSGTICVAYVMLTHYLPLEEALAVVRAARKLVEPSRTLYSALRRMDASRNFNPDKINLFAT